MSQPNILFVFSDQHRYSALGCNGNPLVKTPHLDRLASEGAALDQAFACYPLCSPYRAQLLTGAYCHRNRVICNEYALAGDLPTLPSVLGGAGYRTGFVGKWHLGYGPYPAPARHGFDYLAGYNTGYGFFKGEYHENETGPFKMNGWTPEVETTLGIRFMEQSVAAGKPFALVMGWAPPHWPYDQFPPQFNTYDPAKMDVPGNVPEAMRDYAARELALYYGNVAGLDVQMGRLLEALDRMGAARDTIVCFTSDHGDHLCSHGYGKPWDAWLPPYMRASKATPHEESIHVPFLMRWPERVPAGTRSPTMLDTVDIMPTLLRLAGLACPETVQGHDLSHAPLGRPGPQPDSVYLQNMGVGWPDRKEWTGFWRGVRTDRWLYARWLNNKPIGPWLFDRQNDPLEMKNLAGRGEYAGVQAELEARLTRWIRDTGDPFETGPYEGEKGMLQVGQRFTHERWMRAGK